MSTLGTIHVKQPLRSPVLGTVLRHLVLVAVVATPVVILYDDRANSLELFSIPASFFAGVLLLRLLRRLSQRSAEAAMREDPRPPVLFLRSFNDDGKGRDSHDLDREPRDPLLQAGGNLFPVLRFLALFRVIARLLLGIHNLSLEQELSRIFRRVGPFVAVGKPGERLSTLGAARLYVSDEEWMEVVEGLIRRSGLVIWQAGETEGTWWELARIREICDPTRVILLIPNPKRRPEAFANFRARADTLLPRPIPEASDANFITFDADWNPRPGTIIDHDAAVAWFSPTPLDLETTFYPFLVAEGTTARSKRPFERYGVRRPSPARKLLRASRAAKLQAADVAVSFFWMIGIPGGAIWHASFERAERVHCESLQDAVQQVLGPMRRGDLGSWTLESHAVAVGLLAERPDASCGNAQLPRSAAAFREVSRTTVDSVMPRVLEGVAAGRVNGRDARAVFDSLAGPALRGRWAELLADAERRVRARSYLLDIVYPDPVAVGRELPRDYFETEVMELLSSRMAKPYRMVAALAAGGDRSGYAGVVRVYPEWEQRRYEIVDDRRSVPTSLTLRVRTTTHRGSSTWDRGFSPSARFAAPLEVEHRDMRDVQEVAVDSLLARIADSSPETIPVFRMQ